MTETLADLFTTAGSPVIEWEGGPVFAAFELDRIPQELVVEFLAAKALPVQGLRLRIRGGALAVNDVVTNDVILWRDTAPDRVTVRVQADRGARPPSLKVWNVWRGGLDVIQAWLGNSGMRVDRDSAGDEVLLSCSDGDGPADFDDLKVRLRLVDLR